MDAESLVKELILKSMTPEQQDAILNSVKTSVAQARAVQKQKIGENVDLVVQALKKIESDIRSRYDDLGNLIEKRVASIQDGRDGINGSDGRDGRDGKPGKDGAPGRQGAQGPAGKDGRDGIDGVSVTNAYLDFDGGLVITLSNGNEINVGEIMPMELSNQIKVITNGGGTSQSVLDTLDSLQTQINTLIPSQTGNSGKFLTTNGTSTSWASVAGGLSYQGTWNASTNTPTLASSTGTNGYYYIVSTAGSTNLNGITDWQVGDWLLFNGSVWQKIDQTNLVTSVNGQTGAVSLTYTDVNAIGSITSTDGSVSVSTASGVADLSVAVAASTTNVIVQVRNSTGSTLTKGTVVYISGATGQIPTVSKALANSDASSAQTLGVMSADLANNSNGYVTIIGLVTDIDTSAYTDGAQLYLSGSTAGTLTSTKPYAPTHLVYVAVVEYAHAIHGKLFVKVQNGYEMDELHNVSAQSPSNGQTLVYNTSTSLWEKNTVSLTTGVNGTLPVANGGTGLTSLTAGYIPFGNGTSAFGSSSSLFWDSANSRLGVGTAVPAVQIDSLSASTNQFRVRMTGQADVRLIADTGVGITGTYSNHPFLIKTNSATVATFDASGNLGLGTTSPAAKIHSSSSYVTPTNGISADTLGILSKNNTANGSANFSILSRSSGYSRIYFGNQTTENSQIIEAYQTNAGTGYLAFSTGDGSVAATEKMRLDQSGNLGLGVTPSAWGSSYKVIQGQVGGFALSNDATSNNQMRLSSNAYNNGTNWIYYGTSTATSYEQRVGEHRWYNAPNGTAGNAITFTQAMTLNASGALGFNGANYGTSGQVLTSGGSSASPTWSLVNLASSVTGTLPVANGGTGTTTPSLVAGSNVTITGTWPNQTIAASSGGSGGAGNAYAWFMV